MLYPRLIKMSYDQVMLRQLSRVPLIALIHKGWRLSPLLCWLS